MDEESAMIGHEKAAGASKAKDEGVILLSEAPGESVSFRSGGGAARVHLIGSLKEDRHALHAP
jgi:hypothetical protein